MDLIFTIYLFVLGAALGSFAGATAWRIEMRRDIVRERSECENCHHTLAWYDLLPIVSWLQLKGRCRYCSKLIGSSALLLELGVGAAFALSFLFWPYGFEILGLFLFIIWLLALVGMAILLVYDFRHYILPDVVVWPLAVLGLIMFGLRMTLEGSTLADLPTEALLGLLPITGVYGVLYAVSRGKLIGLGDVKLGVFIGFTVGWEGALLVLLLANYLGFFYVLPSLLRGGLKKSTRMPFGPFLLLATFIGFIWGSQIISFVLGFLLV